MIQTVMFSSILLSTVPYLYILHPLPLCKIKNATLCNVRNSIKSTKATKFLAPHPTNPGQEILGAGLNLERCFTVFLGMRHIFKSNRSPWPNNFMLFVISKPLSVLGNMEITSCVLSRNYAEAHRLRTIDLKYPNLVEMQHPDLNLKKFLVFAQISPKFSRKHQVLTKI